MVNRRSRERVNAPDTGGGKAQRAPDELLTLEIAASDDEGWGSAVVDGRLVKVKGVHVGERAQVRVLRHEGRTSIAALAHLEVALPGRAMPFCPHFGACGGCTMQHFAQTQQVAIKQQRLRDLFAAQEVAVGRVAAPILGPDRGYRRKARLSARYTQKGQRLFLGFREAAGHVVADLETCPMLVPPFAAGIASLRRTIEATTLHATVPQVEIAAGDHGAALVVRHLLPPTGSDLRALRRWCDQQDVVLWLQPGGAETAHTVTLDAPQRLHYADLDDDLHMTFHPLDFIQVNAAVNRRMIELCIDALEPGTGRVLDLFCGIGNFTLPIARHASAVVGVEGSPALVQRANDNARDNGIRSARFICHDLHTHARRILTLGKFDAVVLDPPRAGAAAVAALLPELAPALIIYFSCNPVTLASDARVLGAAGYRVRETRILDMFPNTAHVECCAVFARD